METAHYARKVVYWRFRLHEKQNVGNEKCEGSCTFGLSDQCMNTTQNVCISPVFQIDAPDRFVLCIVLKILLPMEGVRILGSENADHSVHYTDEWAFPTERWTHDQSASTVMSFIVVVTCGCQTPSQRRDPLH